MLFEYPYETATFFVAVLWYFFLILKVYSDQNK